MRYLATVIEVINKTQSLANLPALTEIEQGQRGRDWADVLLDIVPENRLHDALRRAVKDHATAYPINVHEVKNAWSVIGLEEAAEARRRAEAIKAANPTISCKAFALHVKRPGEISAADGMREYADPLDLSKGMIFPCDECRPEAFAQAQTRHREKNPHLTISKTEAETRITEYSEMVMASVAMDRPEIPELPETAEEILQRAYEMADTLEGQRITASAFRYVVNGRGKAAMED